MIKKFLLLCVLTAVVGFSFVSCANKKYSDNVGCSDITKAIQDELFKTNEYAEYPMSEIEYMIDPSLFDSCSVIYSVSSDDISEIGVFHAPGQNSATLLFEEANNYIKQTQGEKREFLRSYMPSELTTLDSASARRFGNYVVFSFSNDSEKIFATVEELLK